MTTSRNGALHSFKRLAFAVCLPLLFFALPSSAQSWTWTNETIDPYGIQSSVAVDKDGNLHVSYFSGGIKYAFRPANSTHWFTMLVAPGGGYSEVPTKIAVDSSGDPHICFTPGVLKYASFENRAWNIQQIDPQSGLIEYNCSLAIAPDGTPHVIWYQYGNPQGGYYLHLKYASLEKGSWIARTVDYGMQAGKWNSLVLDAQGRPHVTYDVFTQGLMKYAYWDGKDWQRSVLDSPDISPNVATGGQGNALVLSREGKAQASFESGDILKYSWEKNDGTWRTEVIDHPALSGSWAGYRTRQALDPQGNPHLAYEDGGALKHAYWDGSEWKIEIIAAAGTRWHRYQDIVIDAKGNIYIVYSDPLDGSLKLATGHFKARTEPTSNEKKTGK